MSQISKLTITEPLSELLKYLFPLPSTCCLLSSACMTDDLQSALTFVRSPSFRSQGTKKGFYLRVHAVQGKAAIQTKKRPDAMNQAASLVLGIIFNSLLSARE